MRTAAECGALLCEDTTFSLQSQSASAVMYSKFFFIIDFSTGSNWRLLPLIPLLLLLLHILILTFYFFRLSSPLFSSLFILFLFALKFFFLNLLGCGRGFNFRTFRFLCVFPPRKEWRKNHSSSNCDRLWQMSEIDVEIGEWTDKDDNNSSFFLLFLFFSSFRNEN